MYCYIKGDAFFFFISLHKLAFLALFYTIFVVFTFISTRFLYVFCCLSSALSLIISFFTFHFILLRRKKPSPLYTTLINNSHSTRKKYKDNKINNRYRCFWSILIDFSPLSSLSKSRVDNIKRERGREKCNKTERSRRPPLIQGKPEWFPLRMAVMNGFYHSIKSRTNEN